MRFRKLESAGRTLVKLFEKHKIEGARDGKIVNQMWQ